MSNSILEEIVFLKNMADKGGLSDDVFVKTSLFHLSTLWNPMQATVLHQYLLQNMDVGFMFDDVFEVPKYEDMTGELELGQVVGNEDVYFRYGINRLPKHVLATGTSGSGKTNFAKVLIDEAVRAGIGSIKISDPKSEYEDIAKQDSDFLLMRWNELRFNPLVPPPNVPKIEWWQSIVGHMSQCFNFWAGGEALLIKLIIKVAKVKENPTIPDLMYALEQLNPRYRQKEYIIMGTIASRLELMDNLLHDVIVTDGSVLPELIHSKYIIQTSGLMSEIESWFLEFLLLWEFLYRIFNPQDRQLTLNIYDECQHRLFSSEKERNIKKIGSSVISLLIDEARALNISIVALSQEPSMLVKGMLNNSWLKVAFHLGSGTEVKTMKDAMGLNEEQTDSLFYLDTGEGIIRMAGGGFMDPFPVKFYEHKTDFGFDDEEFRNHQKQKKEGIYLNAGLKKTGAAGGSVSVSGIGVGGNGNQTEVFNEDYDELG